MFGITFRLSPSAGFCFNMSVQGFCTVTPYLRLHIPVLRFCHQGGRGAPRIYPGRCPDPGETFAALQPSHTVAGWFPLAAAA